MLTRILEHAAIGCEKHDALAVEVFGRNASRRRHCRRHILHQTACCGCGRGIELLILLFLKRAKVLEILKQLEHEHLLFGLLIHVFQRLSRL